MAAVPPYRYSVSDEVFSRFPGYLRGVVVVHEVTNGPSPPQLVDLLREAEGVSAPVASRSNRWPRSRA